MPTKSSRKPSHSSNPRTGYIDCCRISKSLYRESFHNVTLDTGTRYPCTQKELDTAVGINRPTASRAVEDKDRARWYARLKDRPFVDVNVAAREVFDHNILRRTPSAAESDAINRLQTGIEIARMGYWGPDLAIKAFCDLDKVFFCSRLAGHVCLTWRSKASFGEWLLGSTHYLGGGKSVIWLYASELFFQSRSCFMEMLETLLHEMM